MNASAVAHATTPPMRKGSLTRCLTDSIHAAKSNFGMDTPPPPPPPPPPLRLFFFVPGRRLISIIRRLGSCFLSQRQPDGKHQEWCDLIRDEIVHRPVTDSQVGQRVGLLHLKAQPVGEDVGEAGDPS